MICKDYEDLTPIERRDFIGSLVHAATSDSTFFHAAMGFIEAAKRKGLFEGVVINPPTEIKDESEKHTA